KDTWPHRIDDVNQPICRVEGNSGGTFESAFLAAKVGKQLSLRGELHDAAGARIADVDVLFVIDRNAHGRSEVGLLIAANRFYVLLLEIENDDLARACIGDNQATFAVDGNAEGTLQQRRIVLILCPRDELLPDRALPSKIFSS